MKTTLLAALIVGMFVSAAAAEEWKLTTLAESKVEGSAWYRCYIRVPANMTSRAEPDLWSDSVTLSFAGTPGPFVVYLNGKKIIEGGAIPDDARRRFKVPKGILEPTVFNVLAVQTTGTIRKPPILAGYFDELLMGGQWEVASGADIDPTKMTPLATSPEFAGYIETSFRQSSTPLAATVETIPGRKLPPEESLKLMKTPDDLAVDLMLAEPLVAQPTHMSFDERGRLWIAQYRQYPYPAGIKMISRDKFYRGRYDKVPPPPPHHDPGRDIISVHEDTDGDGKFDRHKEVLTGLNMANAVVRGHGGIWVMNTPYLMFYPDADGDDVPDGDPEVRLAGFGLEDTHSVANGLIWGPDGWLYGGQGSTTTSRVTRPGVDPPNAPGVFFEGCMVWRYHPTKKNYEIFAEGGGNTFGLEFDAEGRIYSGHNGGQTRGWHFVQEGIYLMQGVDPGKFGPPRNPYSFGVLSMMGSANEIPRFTHNVLVFEGTGLPPRYTGQIFGTDPLHRTIVASARTVLGSTFTTTDTDTPLAGSDIAFRPVFLAAGPDGALYVADFYEEFIAHGQHYQGQIDPTTGRVFRVRGKESKLNPDINLASKTTAQLVETLSHPNRWHRHTAVRLLGERKDAAAVPSLKSLVQTSGKGALEALWALHQMNALDEATATKALASGVPAVRAWAIRLLGDERKLPSGFFNEVVKLGASESNAEVLCQMASTARRIGIDQALPIVATLVHNKAIVDDSFTPMLCWWTIESHCDANREAVLALLKTPDAWNGASMKKDILPRLMRRMATKGTNAEFLACAGLLESAPSDEHRKLLMTGFEEAFKGRALPPLPEALVTALAKSGHASPILRVRLGDAGAIADALKRVSERKPDQTDDLLTTITLLGEVNVPDAVKPLLAIAKEDARAPLRKAALTALLKYDDPSIAPEVANLYGALPADIRPAAQNLLASRNDGTLALLKLVETKLAPAADIPPDVVLRLKSHEDPAIVARAEKLFPATEASDQETQRAELARVRRVVESIPGDPYAGEAIFTQRCAQCHTLFFKGGNVGPNLTTYQRDDLGTMLTSILEPSAEVREGYATYIVRTKDRRTLSGFLVESDAAVVVLRGSDGQDVRVPRADVKDMKAIGSSLMPAGLLQGLDDQQLRDFFAYLRIPQPISR